MAGASSELQGGDAGRYRISGTLGEGGMGEVFKGVHVELGRDVAIKRLKHDASLDESIVRRFFNEARAVNAIRHENIVEVTDLFTDDQGRAHMVMEHLEGCTLSELVKSSSPLPPSRVAHIGAQIAEALAAAHQAGIIHRDVKPANVFLIKRKSTDDYVKLLDFGIAHLHPDCGGIEATESGQIVGTPVYMPPEQAKGDPVTASADIYSLGVMLYEMLSGDFPFPRSSAIQMMMAHISEPPRPLNVPGLDPAFQKLVERCLSKDSADRPPDAKSIATDLEQWAKRTKRSTAAHRKERHQTQETPVPPAGAFDPTFDSKPKEAVRPPQGQQAKQAPPWIVLALVALVCGGVASAVILTTDSKSSGSTKEGPIEESPSTSSGAIVPENEDDGGRKTLDDQMAKLGLPLTPDSCKSSDPETIKAHQDIATLHIGGKPGVKRAQNAKARATLNALDDKLSPETRFWSARTYLFEGDLERAIGDAGRAYESCNDFAGAHAIKGTAYVLQEKYDQAIVALDLALDLAPKYSDARFNLAYAQSADNDLVAGVANFTAVLIQNPGATDARYLRGESYIGLGKLKKARKDLEKAVIEWGDTGSPMSPSAWYALSHARRQTGDPALARQAACKASELGHKRAVCPTARDPLTDQADEWVSDHFETQR
jgi:serine/threonine protein kinase